MKIKILLVFAMMLSSGVLSAKDLKDVFPVGIYSVNDTSYVSELRKAGFNIIQTYSREPFFIKKLAEECVREDVFLLAYPHETVNSAYASEAGKWNVIWYLYDEPDIFAYAPEMLERSEAEIKNAYPDKLTAFVISQGITENDYYSIADILMVDWYPFPHLPLQSTGDQVYFARKSLDSRGLAQKPLWAVIQAFDWFDFPQRRKDKVGGFPSAAQIRFMTYNSIVNGATGIFYFHFKTKDGILPDNEANWNSLLRIVKELNSLSEIFAKGKVIENPAKTNYPVIIKTWAYKNKKYSIVVNASHDPEEMPEEFFDPAYRLKFESRKSLKSITAEGSRSIPAHRVYVFEYK